MGPSDLPSSIDGGENEKKKERDSESAKIGKHFLCKVRVRVLDDVVKTA